MISLAAGTTQVTEASTILRRIAKKDKTAVKDCIDAYGNFIWALARKLTKSRTEAERASEEIFTDIWRYQETSSNIHLTEKEAVALIALRRLIKSDVNANEMSMANIDVPNEQGGTMDRISESV